MIRYFRINDPYRLVGLLVLLLIIYLPLFIDFPSITIPELKDVLLGEKMNEGFALYTEIVDNTGPLAAWLMEFIDTLFGRSMIARHILAFILIFLQGAYVGIMLILRKAFNENTYIPSFLFCLLFFFSYDTLSLSGELIGSAFLLLALNNLFKEIEFRTQRDETVFNLGLYISFASLFSFAFWIYLFCIMIVLVFFTRTTARKFSLLVFGFVLPHLLMLTMGYLNGSLGSIWDYYYVSNLSFERDVFLHTRALLVLGAIPLLYFVISMIILQREARFSKYQSLLLQVMFLWLSFSFVYLFFCKDLRPQNLIVFIPALSFILTHFFLFIRRRKFVELNAWILFLGIVGGSYLSRYDKLESVDYSALAVSPAKTQYIDQRILVLSDQFDHYRDNQLATFYLNWRLSEEIFRNPDYYENLTEVYHAFSKDPPDIVVDPENLLRPFLDRSPSLKKIYKRQGIIYRRSN